VLGALEGAQSLGLAAGLSALETQGDLLGRLGLLVEHGLGLATITSLLPVVSALTCSERVNGGGEKQRNPSQNAPWANREAFPLAAWATLLTVCFLHFLQKVRIFLGMVTCGKCQPGERGAGVSSPRRATRSHAEALAPRHPMITVARTSVRLCPRACLRSAGGENGTTRTVTAASPRPTRAPGHYTPDSTSSSPKLTISRQPTQSGPAQVPQSRSVASAPILPELLWRDRHSRFGRPAESATLAHGVQPVHAAQGGDPRGQRAGDSTRQTRAAAP
jgi:hypothetical protein